MKTKLLLIAALLLAPASAHANEVQSTIAKHAAAHGRKPPLALQLHALGPKALPSMLDMLVHERAGSAKLAVIEAIGLHRDAHSLPVLAAQLTKEDADYATARTVTEAIARLESDEAVRRITTALTTAKGDRARGILAGMGSCHREAIAHALSHRASTTSDDETLIAIARALGDTGNAWAWQTMTSRAEEPATRSLAARTLVDIYVHHASAEVRSAATSALLVVDDPSTSSLVDAARRGADAPTIAALDTVATKLARNPTHAR